MCQSDTRERERESEVFLGRDGKGSFQTQVFIIMPYTEQYTSIQNTLVVGHNVWKETEVEEQVISNSVF